MLILVLWILVVFLCLTGLGVCCLLCWPLVSELYLVLGSCQVGLLAPEVQLSFALKGHSKRLNLVKSLESWTDLRAARVHWPNLATNEDQHDNVVCLVHGERRNSEARNITGPDIFIFYAPTFPLWGKVCILFIPHKLWWL